MKPTLNGERLEVFRLRAVSLTEGANLDRGVGKGWKIKADRYGPPGNYRGRLIITTESPREIMETTPEGFILTRAAYDFI